MGKIVLTPFQKMVWEELKTYYSENKKIPSFVLVGVAGTGKTTIAKLIGRKLKRKGLIDKVLYAHYPEETKEILQTLKEEKGIYRFLVIVDEVRREFLTQTDISNLEKLMVYLYENDIPFILVMNENLLKSDISDIFSTPFKSKVMEKAKVIEADRRENPRLERIKERWKR